MKDVVVIKRAVCQISIQLLPAALQILSLANLKILHVIPDRMDGPALVFLEGEALPDDCETYIKMRFVTPKFVKRAYPDGSFEDRLDAIELDQSRDNFDVRRRLREVTGIWRFYVENYHD